MAIAVPTKMSVRQPLGAATLVLLAPSVLAVTAFFIVPMTMIVVSSLTESDNGPAVLSFGHYVEIVTDSFYWDVLLRTVRISIYTTVAALLVSYPAALYLFFSETKWRRIFLIVAISPLFISVVVRTYGWIVILSPNGALNAVIPGGLPFQLLYTEPGIVIGLVHVYVPFMLLSLNASLAKVDRRFLRAAASLGASNLRIFKDIIVPLSTPGIVAGCTVVFTIAMTAFSTPVLLGGSRSKTMPYLIYQRVMLMSDWHVGSALALFLLLMTAASVFLLARAMRMLARYAGP